jgi:hypothetical protein
MQHALAGRAILFIDGAPDVHLTPKDFPHIPFQNTACV